MMKDKAFIKETIDFTSILYKDPGNPYYFSNGGITCDQDPNYPNMYQVRPEIFEWNDIVNGTCVQKDYTEFKSLCPFPPCAVRSC